MTKKLIFFGILSLLIVFVGWQLHNSRHRHYELSVVGNKIPHKFFSSLHDPAASAWMASRCPSYLAIAIPTETRDDQQAAASGRSALPFVAVDMCEQYLKRKRSADSNLGANAPR
jgi:hypothetical protein